MSDYKQKIGKNGEDLATIYLEKKGMQILEKNFYSKYGEIDLIAKDKNEYVFVEVKTRSSQEHGHPKEAVNRFKQKNLILTSRFYLQKHHLEETDWRIDVIEVKLFESPEKRIEHIQNAVTYF